MQGFSKSVQNVWPWIAVCGLLGLALGFRFWGLDRFNALVFDEIYYAKYAQNYLKHEPFFDAHPPLGKYLIALGLWLSHYIPMPATTVNSLTGATYAPWSYRWMDALTGSLIPVIVVGIAYALSHRWRYALIAGLLTSLDGLLLVESRYALINIYLIFWGLLGQLLFLMSLQQPSILRRWGFLSLAGICLGAAVAVKWNGLGFGMGLLLTWVVMRLLHPSWPKRMTTEVTFVGQSRILQSFPQLKGVTIAFSLGVIPLLVYTLLWIPHLEINQTSLHWLHEQMLGYHAHMKSGPEVHPYCSRWYTWPLMLRPMSYFYEVTRSLSDPLPPLTPSVPAGEGKVIYDVHAMGNPLLWWSATLALITLGLQWIDLIRQGGRRLQLALRQQPLASGTSLFILINYGANFLPWIAVSRCTFIYLYMGASIYSFLAIAYLIDEWLGYPQWNWRLLGWLMLALIILAFLYWLPVYLGLPLSPTGFRDRMLLRSWI